MLPAGRPRLRRRITLSTATTSSRPLKQQQQQQQHQQQQQQQQHHQDMVATQSVQADAPAALDMALGDAEQPFTPGPSAIARDNALMPAGQLLNSEPFLWDTFGDQLSPWPPEEHIGAFQNQVDFSNPSGGYLALEEFQARPTSGKSTDYYLDRLASLNAALTKKLTASAGGSAATETQATNTSPAAGQLLRCTQEYVQILRHFMLSVPLTTAPSLATRNVTTDSDTDTDDDEDVKFASCDDTDEAPRTAATSDTSSSTTQDTPTMSSIEYPIMIALITAYSSLVRLHRNWLQTTLSALQVLTLRQQELFSNPSTPCRHMLDGYPGRNGNNDVASGTLPTVLPGLALDGFSLSGHRSLQIHIVSETSLELLWRAERGIASLAASNDGSGSGSILNSVRETSCHQNRAGEPSGQRRSANPCDGVGSYMSLLRTMLSQEAATTYRSPTSKKANTTASRPASRCLVGWKSLSSMAKQIKRETRRNYCLQLDEGSLPSGIVNFEHI